MQLTPRNLVMACGAMLAGGAVFGVITTLMPAVSLPTATAVNPTTTPTATADDLGDEEITFPASPVASPVPWPTPIATSPIPTATSPTPVVPSTPTPRPRPTARAAAGQSARASRPPRPTATPTTTRRPAPAPRLTTVTGGWQAPSLHVGANTIALPRLTSRATVRVTVGCSPSSACHLNGDQLVIDSGGDGGHRDLVGTGNGGLPVVAGVPCPVTRASVVRGQGVMSGSRRRTAAFTRASTEPRGCSPTNDSTSSPVMNADTTSALTSSRMTPAALSRVT